MEQTLSPPPSAPSTFYPDALLLNFEAVKVSDRVTPLNLAAGVVSSIDNRLNLYSQELPATWQYTLLIVVLILLEGALVGLIAIDRHWEKDLPFDPTGDLDRLRSFIEANADVFKWVGISLVIIQSLSLLLALILRSMVSTRTVDHDIEGDNDARGRTWEPLLNPQLSQTSGAIKGDSDIWSSRMREKYGLHSGGDAKYNLLNQNASVDMKSNKQ